MNVDGFARSVARDIADAVRDDLDRESDGYVSMCMTSPEFGAWLQAGRPKPAAQWLTQRRAAEA